MGGRPFEPGLQRLGRSGWR